MDVEDLLRWVCEALKGTSWGGGPPLYIREAGT